MPALTIAGKTTQVEEGKRLVLAIEDSGVKIGHRCGGYANCTTCRVEFLDGEPETMTKAEYMKLMGRDLFGKARLSCQIICDHDMEVQPLLTSETMPDWQGDTGPTPEVEVTPEAEWFPVEDLEAGATG